MSFREAISNWGTSKPMNTADVLNGMSDESNDTIQAEERKIFWS